MKGKNVTSSTKRRKEGRHLQRDWHQLRPLTVRRFSSSTIYWMAPKQPWYSQHCGVSEAAYLTAKFGNNVKTLRKAVGLTQERAAEKAGIIAIYKMR